MFPYIGKLIENIQWCIFFLTCFPWTGDQPWEYTRRLLIKDQKGGPIYSLPEIKKIGLTLTYFSSSKEAVPVRTVVGSVRNSLHLPREIRLIINQSWGEGGGYNLFCFLLPWITVHLRKRLLLERQFVSFNYTCDYANFFLLRIKNQEEHVIHHNIS